MSSLATYLSKNYLTASNPTSSDLSNRPKKRRKKDKPSASNTDLIIADDDEDLSFSKHRSPEDENEDTPTYDTNIRTTEFRRAKKNNWKTINNAGGGTSLATSSIEASDQAAADRILADAARDSDARRRQAEVDDEAPAIAGETVDMESTAPPQRKAGLQTAAETAALSAAAAKSSKNTFTKQRRSAAAAEAEETVYRDATGRRIDISMKRAEARAVEQERQRQEKREKEEAMGEVQRREKEERKQAVEDAKFLTVARYADDEGINEEMRAVGRWGDPMLGYVNSEKKKGSDGGGGAATVTGSSATRKKDYQGAAAPNRYGIRPGWRWDGVDRGNGFEEEWFQARSRKSRNENLEYQWQMDE